MNAIKFFLRSEITKSLPAQSHRSIPADDDPENAIYLEAEKEARKNQREAFKSGVLRQKDCLDNLWDSDVDGCPPDWDDGLPQKKLGQRPFTPPPTQRASGSKGGG